MRQGIGLLFLAACVGGSVAAAPAVVGPLKKLTLRANLARAVAGPDTLVMVPSWVNPTDDGRGPIDSLRLTYTGIGKDTVVKFSPPFPSTHTWRQIIPASAYGGTSYNVRVAATTFRRAAPPTQLLSPLVNIALPEPAVPGVTGLTVQAVKVP